MALMTVITEAYNHFNDYSKANPVIAGAVSLYALGITTFLCRGLPVSVYNTVKNQCTTTLTFDDAGNNYNQENFLSFSKWFENHKWSRYSRALSLDTLWNNDNNSDPVVVGIGDGTHYFFYKHRFFTIHRSSETKAGANKLIHTAHITMLGRKKKILYDLIDEFKYKLPPEALSIHKYDNTEWEVASVIERRNINTIIINQDTKDKILEIINQFYASEDWYKSRGLSYKKTIIFHGVPGTGKTSLIKGLASHFQRNLAIININAVSDRSFENALSSAPTNSFIVIEDFDSASSTTSRDNDDSKNNSAINGVMSSLKLLSLSGILNTLDGVIGLDNKIIFMTTNVIDRIDSAILRKGRVDYIFEIKALEDIEIREYIRMMYHDTPDKNFVIPIDTRFKPILGCDLQALFFEYHTESVQDFIKAIPQYD